MHLKFPGPLIAKGDESLAPKASTDSEQGREPAPGLACALGTPWQHAAPSDQLTVTEVTEARSF